MKRQSGSEGPLTSRQADALDFIVRYEKEFGRAPTYAAIGKALGVSRITAYEHVFRLKCKGYLSQDRKPLEVLPHSDYAMRCGEGGPSRGGGRISRRIRAAAYAVRHNEGRPSRADERIICSVREAAQALEGFQVSKAERILKAILAR